MVIKRFEDIEAWQSARELTRKIYELTKNTKYALDYGLKKIQDAAGSTMHNIAEGFDSEKRIQCLFIFFDMQSDHALKFKANFMALDQQYITETEFQDTYDYAGRTRYIIRGFIKYLLITGKNNKHGFGVQRSGFRVKEL